MPLISVGTQVKKKHSCLDHIPGTNGEQMSVSVNRATKYPSLYSPSVGIGAVFECSCGERFRRVLRTWPYERLVWTKEGTNVVDAKDVAVPERLEPEGTYTHIVLPKISHLEKVMNEVMELRELVLDLQEQIDDMNG